jgi:acetate kinase
VRVLVVNAGSSSLKLDLLDRDQLVARETLPAVRAEIDADAVAAAVDRLGRADAVGHRIVHGGAHYRAPVLVDDQVLRDLTELSSLAPLHQAKSLAALRAVSRVSAGVPAVVCFDTAFHATLPAAARTYALPRPWRERWGLRKYGFHGLAHAWAARRAAELLGRPSTALRLVTCHLGAGASLTAVHPGESVDTTMGFTPLDGLVMATRSGSVDPGLLLWLLEHAALTETEMADALEHESGLLALAGTADMREVLDGAARGEPRAVLAVAVYTHHLRAGIAAMTAAMGGLDAVVFSGGVGENAAEVRAAAIDGLGFLGAGIDPLRNREGHGDRDVSAPGRPVRTLVVHAREDLEIAREVHALLDLRAT